MYLLTSSERPHGTQLHFTNCCVEIIAGFAALCLSSAPEDSYLTVHKMASKRELLLWIKMLIDFLCYINNYLIACLNLLLVCYHQQSTLLVMVTCPCMSDVECVSTIGYSCVIVWVWNWKADGSRRRKGQTDNIPVQAIVTPSVGYEYRISKAILLTFKPCNWKTAYWMERLITKC